MGDISNIKDGDEDYLHTLSRFKVYATGYISPLESCLVGYSETMEGAENMCKEVKLHFPTIFLTEIVEMDDVERQAVLEWRKRLNAAYRMVN
jgi:hypothetical protein